MFLFLNKINSFLPLIDLYILLRINSVFPFLGLPEIIRNFFINLINLSFPQLNQPFGDVFCCLGMIEGTDMLGHILF